VNHLVPLALLLSLLGCGDDDLFPGPPFDGDAGATRDDAGAMTPTLDGGLEATDDAGAAEPPQFGIFVDPSRSDRYGESVVDDFFEPGAEATCFDDIDNDGEGGEDCDDAGCSDLATCCIDDGDCCDPAVASPLPTEVDFDSCSLPCGAEAIAGGPSPSLETDGEGGYLRPGGDPESDGALVFGAVDLETRRAAVTFSLVEASECGPSCLETVSIGWSRRAPEGAPLQVDPLVALTYSGARDRVLLVVEGSERASFETGAARWRLVLRPTGAITVARDAESATFEDAFDPGLAHLVVFGRTRNPDTRPGTGAGLRTLATEVALCDMPRAWTRRELPGFAGAEAPSLARDGDGALRIAFERNGAIFFAREDGAAWVAEEGRFAPELIWADTVAEPELVWDGGWVLYFVGIDGGGVARIGRAVEGAEGFVADVDPLPLEVGLRDPNVTLLPQPVLVARADDMLVGYYDDGGWTRITEDQTQLDEVTRAPGELLGGASLVAHGDAWRLLSTHRRGARWWVRLSASEELAYWRPLGVVLEGSGQGFDGLGVRGVDAIASDDQIQIVYLGEDGRVSSLGMAIRDAAATGMHLD